MSAVQKAAEEFFEEIVKHVVNDLIDLASDADVTTGRIIRSMPSPVDMQTEIIKRMRQYRDVPQSRIA